MNEPNEIIETPDNPNNAAETTIHVNELGATTDSTVVIEEADRTVLLTKDETIIIPKTETFDLAPKNRPRKVYGGMWGITEKATIAVAMLAVLTVILLFVFLVMPAQNELDKNRAERDRLEAELNRSKSKYGDITSTEQGVAKLVTSVDDFETRFLPVATNGRNALYQRINGLIGGYGLVNTSGPDYTPLDVSANSQSSGDATGKAKYQSIFPGVYVTMTLEGSYQNLRRFIREIETSQQFVVISTVELEPTETKANQNQDQTTTVTRSQARTVLPSPPNQITQYNPNNQFNQVPPNNPIAGGQMPPNQPPPFQGEVQPQFPNQTKLQPATTITRTVTKAPRGKTHGEIVSLHLEMAAYFRRPNFVPLVPQITVAP